MRNLLTVIPTLLFAILGNAQQVKLVRDLKKDPFANGWHNWIYYNTDDLPNEGKFRVCYDSAYLHLGLLGEMKGGKRSGTWTSYYPNGRVCDITPYKGGNYDGKVITFSVRGDTTSITGYSDGKRDGPYIAWAEKPWTNERYIVRIENAVLGSREGWQLQFDWTGDTLHKAFYKNDVLQGNDIRWYRNQIISIGHYEPGKGVVYTYPRYTEAKDQTTLYLSFVSYKNLDADAFRKLDSISYYTNLQQLTLEVDPAHVKDIPVITQKLKAISSLMNLTSLGFVGSFTQIPPTVFSCSSIEAIRISGEITSISAEIMGWKNLHAITIDDNSKLNFASALKLLSQCSALRELRLPLDSGKVFPKEFALMSNLYYLSLGGWKTCGDYYSGEVDYSFIYKLKNLRSFEVCSDQYMKIDQIVFGANLPDCQLLVFETCFSADAKVLMANKRLVAIKDVCVGDTVLAWNEVIGMPVPSVVTRQQRHYQPIGSLLAIKFTTGSGEISFLHATAIHPFQVNGNWVEAGDLKRGDRAQYYNNNMLVEILIEDVSPSVVRDEFVYNLSTADHTYFVDGILVHNK